MEVKESRDTWNGMPVLQFDFLMTDQSVLESGMGDVRVLVSARKNCAPYVKWVFANVKRRGYGQAAYKWLAQRFGRPLRVHDVCGVESIQFHRAMKKKGLVEKFNVSASA